MNALGALLFIGGMMALVYLAGGILEHAREVMMYR